MLDWISENRELLIAIFGAGGAGAVALSALFTRRKGGASRSAAAPNVTASSAGGGIAAAHGGTGNIDIRTNEAADEKFIREVQTDLDLSLTEAARLLKAMPIAKLRTAEASEALGRIAAEPSKRAALGAALKANDIPLVADLLGSSRSLTQGEPRAEQASGDF